MSAAVGIHPTQPREVIRSALGIQRFVSLFNRATETNQILELPLPVRSTTKLEGFNEDVLSSGLRGKSISFKRVDSWVWPEEFEGLDRNETLVLEFQYSQDIDSWDFLLFSEFFRESDFNFNHPSEGSYLDKLDVFKREMLDQVLVENHVSKPSTSPFEFDDSGSDGDFERVFMALDCSKLTPWHNMDDVLKEFTTERDGLCMPVNGFAIFHDVGQSWPILRPHISVYELVTPSFAIEMKTDSVGNQQYKYYQSPIEVVALLEKMIPNYHKFSILRPTYSTADHTNEYYIKPFLEELEYLLTYNPLVRSLDDYQQVIQQFGSLLPD
jgi:hypothetical protein